MSRAFGWMFALGLCVATQVLSGQGHGRYSPDMVGSAKAMDSRGILFQPDREWLMDFEGAEGQVGVTTHGGDSRLSTRWRMMGRQSLEWNGGPSDTLSFPVDMTVQGAGKGFAYGSLLRLSLGVFLESRNEEEPPPSLEVALTTASGESLYGVTIYLHKAGWNVLDVEPKLKSGTAVGSLTLRRLSGPPGPLWLDNLFLFLKPKGVGGLATAGLLKPESAFGGKRSSTSSLTPDEKKAFKTIADRIVPPVEPLAKLDDKKMRDLVAFAESWAVEAKGNLANGKFPLYYYRAVPGDLVADSSTYFMYKENQDFCGRMKDLGLAWTSVQDPGQKAILGGHLANLVRLAATFGGIPNAWYNGRGFVEGVFYGRELLDREGILAPIARQCILQYGADLMVGSEPIWEKPPQETGRMVEASRVEFDWSCTADDFNTGSRSTWLCANLLPDGPEKADFLRRLSIWYSRVAMAWAPNVNGTLKPDGSWYHHWGNRFDNYGWQGAFRGVADIRFWLSGTPFQLEAEARARVDHMADVYRKVVLPDGTYGTPDNFHALAGVSNGNTYAHQILSTLAKAVDEESAGRGDNPWARAYLALSDGTSKQTNAPLVAQWSTKGFMAQPVTNAVVAMPYAGMLFRRGIDWSLSVRGLRSMIYHTQYERDGFLFYQIGGLGLIQQGLKHSMWTEREKFELLGRHDPTMQRMTAGYHPSYAPLVTAREASWDRLKSLYYQKGAGTFAGGVQMDGTHGLYAQVFDAGLSSNYSGTPVDGLAFRKAVFVFDRTVVALGRDIHGAHFTGLLQEPPVAGAPGIRLGGAAPTSPATVGSDRLPWAETGDGSLGVVLWPGQSVGWEDGDLAAGNRKGPMARLFLKHTPGASGSGSAFGVVYLVKPEKGAAEAWSRAMASGKAPVQVFQDDASLLAVHSVKEDARGYAFFAGAAVTNGGPVVSVDVPCLVLVKREGPETLRVSVADPDLHNERTEPNPFGYSIPTSVRLTLNGAWNVGSVETVRGLAAPSVSAEAPVDGRTTVTVKVRDGLTTEWLLVAP